MNALGRVQIRMPDGELLDACFSCGRNPVTWPKICEDCIDHEAQAQLALQYGFHYVEDPMGGAGYMATGMECITCGMIYDGGMRCTYCGDPSPTGDSEGEDEEDEY